MRWLGPVHDFAQFASGRILFESEGGHAVKVGTILYLLGWCPQGWLPHLYGEAPTAQI